MNEENFLVKFIPSKHCFLQFSNKWFQKLNNPKCLCLRLVLPNTKHHLYLSWAPQPSYGLNDCSVGINATFAQGLGIQENDLIAISSEQRLPSLRQVFLTPVSADDYEILEMCRNNVEVLLLNQIRIVNVSQVISIWVSKTTHLKLVVDRLESNLPYGRLEQMTELYIENVNKTERNKSHTNTDAVIDSVPSSRQHQKNGSSSLWDKLSEFLPQSVVEILKQSGSPKDDNETSQVDNSLLLCRVHPFPNTNKPPNCCSDVHNEGIHPFNVFIHRRTLEKENCWPHEKFVSVLLDSKSSQSVVLCRLKVVPKRKTKSSNSRAISAKTTLSSSPEENIESVCVRLHLIEDSCSFFRMRTNVSCAFLSCFLRGLLHLDVGSKIVLTAYHPPLDKLLTEVKLVPARKLDKTEAKTLLEQFEKRLVHQRGVLVNNYYPLPVAPASSPVLVLLSPPQLECWPLTCSDLLVCTVTVADEEEVKLESFRVDDKDGGDVHQTTSVFAQLVKAGITSLEFGLQLVEAQNQDMVLDNILITGKQGSGKSRLVEAICSAVSGPPHHVYVSSVDCKSIKGKKAEIMGKIVAEKMAECVYYQPAVLVLEDLYCVAGVPTRDTEPSQESLYFLRMATILKELLWTLRVDQCVTVIATVQSQDQVHPQLLSARGRHTFTTCLHIPALEKDDRLCVLQELLKAKFPSAQLPDLDNLAAKTKGCVAQDLHKLVDRIVFKACQRQAQEVGENDLVSAYRGFVPADLVNVSLVHHSPYTFACVGGLQSAKQLLTEVLIWPTKYPEVFSQCPLRLERGVMLYGAPGTGKTLLANAIAGESGLNFITVKGPELLSKYIGASEEAVRNVFQKAQSAQPCILFFDEFDSLAPRRGHDSTGVTDRVVNQLLTQMDGVEVLEGVWVLVAASRPDLIDPALLRPGRIGTLLHCPLPTQDDRLAILNSLSGRLQMSADVDLARVAGLTEGYTGADLQALLFTAQMSAYDALYQDSGVDVQVVKHPVQNVVVSQADMLAAITDTKPSLKPEDRLRFDQILTLYEKMPSYIGVKLTNYLPDELKALEPINRMRQWLINWLQV